MEYKIKLLFIGEMHLIILRLRSNEKVWCTMVCTAPWCGAPGCMQSGQDVKAGQDVKVAGLNNVNAICSAKLSGILPP